MPPRPGPLVSKPSKQPHLDLVARIHTPVRRIQQHHAFACVMPVSCPEPWPPGSRICRRPPSGQRHGLFAGRGGVGARLRMVMVRRAMPRSRPATFNIS